MVASRAPGDARADAAARGLALGLAVLVALAPLPFGAVEAGGRAALEIGAGLLLLLWLVRGARRPTPLPSRAARWAVAGLLVFAVLQILPLGRPLVGWLSPAALDARAQGLAPADARAAEARLLGRDPAELDPPPALSVAPAASASALRTGAALVALFLVATTVAAVAGVRGLSLALLAGAAFQALYGVLVLASGFDRIWNVPKRHYLDSATGTFVNRNHFACCVVLGLTAGLGLILTEARRSGPRPERTRDRLLHAFEAQRGRVLLLGLLFVTGLAGLLASFSRAGIATGAAGLGLVLAASGQGRRSRRLAALAVALLVVVAAAIPLIQIGPERLVERYLGAVRDLTTPGSRLTVAADTLALARSFPVFGSGYGSFAEVYPLFRSPEVRRFYAHAHDDLLQALAEGGAIGIGLGVLLLLSIARAARAALRGSERLLAAGLAAGLVAFLLHGLVDFNLHIPANAALAAVLAGALEGLGARTWNASS